MVVNLMGDKPTVHTSNRFYDHTAGQSDGEHTAEILTKMKHDFLGRSPEKHNIPVCQL